MDQIILGLLLLKDRTIYQLRDRIKKGLHFMYSSSMGSIQAAIKKLLKLGYIHYTEITENGMHKKIYSITETGRVHFYDWVNAPVENITVKSPELVKVYFMGLADAESRDKIIANHIENLSGQYELVCAIDEAGDNVDIPPEGREVFKYQRMCAQYGRDLLEFNIQWFEKLRSRVRSDQI
ncbi:MAG: PadR family transcriptional regulator [Tissierellia bacterium]|nr:PadR family transcriptional regulator [Tissierellia bacterium]